jgi:cytidylate kinase
LAKEIGQRTGFKVWDKELLTAISKEAGADERFLESLDERRRKMIDDTMYGSFMGSKLSNTHYFRSLLRVLQTIGAHGKGIIVGRGSNYIIKSQKALRVRIVGSMEKRVAYVMKLEGISKESAEEIIETRDSERGDFIQHHFKRDSRDAKDYDLVLNAGAFSISQMADLALLAYEIKVGKTVPLVA